MSDEDYTADTYFYPVLPDSVRNRLKCLLSANTRAVKRPALT